VFVLTLLSFCSLRPPPLSSTLFPYTTLFRSLGVRCGCVGGSGFARRLRGGCRLILVEHVDVVGLRDDLLSLHRAHDLGGGAMERSEEHTSELQSQSNLVCRLLLEKKKKKKNN